MGTVSTQLRFDPKWIRTDPLDVVNMHDMVVRFEMTDENGIKSTETTSIARTHTSRTEDLTWIYYEVTVDLEENTNYTIKVRVEYEGTEVESEEMTIDTSDTSRYIDIEKRFVLMYGSVPYCIHGLKLYLFEKQSDYDAFLEGTGDEPDGEPGTNATIPGYVSEPSFMFNLDSSNTGPLKTYDVSYQYEFAAGKVWIQRIIKNPTENSYEYWATTNEITDSGHPRAGEGEIIYKELGKVDFDSSSWLSPNEQSTIEVDLKS